MKVCLPLGLLVFGGACLVICILFIAYLATLRDRREPE